MIKAFLYYEKEASQKTHESRDQYVKEFADISGVWFNCWQLPEAVADLESNVPAAKNKLESIAKKAGLTPNGEIEYTMHAGKLGPMIMHFTVKANG